MSKRKLVIFPFNGNGIEALDCLTVDDFEFVGFVDDDHSKKSSQFKIFSREVFKELEDLYVLAVPGSPQSFQSRKEIISSLPFKDPKRFVTIIHPTASVGKNVQIGRNCLIMAGVVITSNACIGDHICVLPNSIIHHDVIIEDYTLIGSKVVIAGGTRVGENCYIGSGSNLMNGISVGDCSLIGMGSNVLRSVVENSKMAGNPAKNLNIEKKTDFLKI